MRRAIPGFPGYEADETGVIWSLPKPNYPTERALRQDTDKDGYRKVVLYISGKRHPKKVHVLICLTFHGPQPSPKHQGCHQDGNPDNNTMGNVSWGTAKKNAEDRAGHGNTARGDRIGNSKLSPGEVTEIRTLLSRGELSQQKIADLYGVNQAYVSRIKLGKNWKHLK